jgi:fumarate reductase flavoprotein subunit
LESNVHGANPELVAAYRLQKMLKVALCVALGARERTESRGAHSREDHPQRDDANWLKRTITTWKEEGDTLPTIDYEAIDVANMELPPGFRGYGQANHRDHPDTEERLSEVTAIREQLKDADRFEIQSRLMPFDHLLPERYRERNERLEEPANDR